MPAKTDLYAEFMTEYYRLEEVLLAEVVAAGLVVAKTLEAGSAARVLSQENDIIMAR